ncbi:MAG: hypothetical protein M3273_04305 [Actinomycetota bacterium]|nr:hypothetical protein [Actinomycetota bacterium]
MLTALGSRKAIAWLALGVTAALVSVTVQVGPADAAKKKKKKVERSVEGQYIGATGVRGVQDSPCAGAPAGCVVFPVEKGEEYVSIEVVDAAGDAVWASVYVYGYSDGTDSHEHVCGATDFPLSLADGLEELVIVITQTTGGATNPCAGPATQGTVKAVFSNVP